MVVGFSRIECIHASLYLSLFLCAVLISCYIGPLYKDIKSKEKLHISVSRAKLIGDPDVPAA